MDVFEFGIGMFALRPLRNVDTFNHSVRTLKAPRTRIIYGNIYFDSWYSVTGGSAVIVIV